MIRHGKWQPRDDDVLQRVARHVDALPKAVRAEQHRLLVALESLEHRRSRHAGPLHEAVPAVVGEEVLEFLCYLTHQLEVGEQHEGAATAHPDEVTELPSQSVAEFRLARIRHLAGDE